MKHWEPKLVTKLSLPKLQLVDFHVGTLANLEELDLSYNYISELVGSGIEQCVNLVKCNLSHNRITKKQQLRVFEYSSFQLQNIFFLTLFFLSLDLQPVC